jgi:hypothetical protein
MKLFQLVFIGALCAGFALSVKSMEPPTKQTKGSDDVTERFLDAARNGSESTVRGRLFGEHFSRQTASQLIFATRDGIDALRLAIEGSENLSDDRYSRDGYRAKIKFIAEKMIEYDWERGINVMCNWLEILASRPDRHLSSRQSQARNTLLTILNKTLVQAERNELTRGRLMAPFFKNAMRLSEQLSAERFLDAARDGEASDTGSAFENVSNVGQLIFAERDGVNALRLAIEGVDALRLAIEERLTIEGLYSTCKTRMKDIVERDYKGKISDIARSMLKHDWKRAITIIGAIFEWQNSRRLSPTEIEGRQLLMEVLEDVLRQREKCVIAELERTDQNYDYYHYERHDLDDEQRTIRRRRQIEDEARSDRELVNHIRRRAGFPMASDEQRQREFADLIRRRHVSLYRHAIAQTDQHPVNQVLSQLHEDRRVYYILCLMASPLVIIPIVRHLK